MSDLCQSKQPLTDWIIITPQETPGKYAPFLAFSSDTVVFVSSVLLLFCLLQAWLLEQLFPYITKCGDGIVQTAGSKHKLIGCEQNWVVHVLQIESYIFPKHTSTHELVNEWMTLSLAVSIEAPPTSTSDLLFVRDSQSEERRLKEQGEGAELWFNQSYSSSEARKCFHVTN